MSLAREGWRPARGELLVVAIVDEETGGSEGAVWLCENHPDKVRCDYVLNEGAGTVIPFDGERRLRRLRRREGRLPLHAHDARRAPATRRCPASATTRC